MKYVVLKFSQVLFPYVPGFRSLGTHPCSGYFQNANSANAGPGDSKLQARPKDFVLVMRVWDILFPVTHLVVDEGLQGSVA